MPTGLIGAEYLIAGRGGDAFECLPMRAYHAMEGIIFAGQMNSKGVSQVILGAAIVLWPAGPPLTGQDYQAAADSFLVETYRGKAAFTTKPDFVDRSCVLSQGLNC